MPFPLAVLDATHVDLASLDYREGFQHDMALMHNALIRGLNSIYEYAPVVSGDDLPSFLTYIHAFHETCKLHHDGEDLNLFREFEPHIQIGESLAQHIVIGDGLRDLHDWTASVQESPSRYSATGLRALIDTFAEEFYSHMKDEVEMLKPAKFKSFISEEALRGLVLENVKWIASHSTLPFFIPFLAAHRDLETNQFWPSFPPQALEILPKLAEMHQGAWAFAPFHPVTGAPQFYHP